MIKKIKYSTLMKRYIILIMSVVMFSCIKSNKHEKVTATNSSTQFYYIDVESSFKKIESIPLSTLGNKLKYIPLENRPECMIKYVSGIFISDSIIFVRDHTIRLLLFDARGRFIRQIGKQGRGPGEYPDIVDFKFDKDLHEVYILSYRKVSVYDTLGRFKREFSLDFPCTQFIIDNNKNLIFHSWSEAIPSNDTIFSWYICSNTGIIKKKIVNSLKRVNRGIIIQNTPLFISRNKTYLMEFGIDTLYKLIDNLKTPYAIINLGKLKHPVDPTLSESLQKHDKIWITEMSEANNYFLLKLWCGRDSIIRCVFNKLTNDFIILKENGFFNDIDNGTNFWPMNVLNDSLMVTAINSLELVKYKTVANINETSNPVIMILTK